MATRNFAGKTIHVNDEGYLTDPFEWDKDIAVEIAREEGIPELSFAHWKVIDFCRKFFTTNGKPPILRQIANGTCIPTRELFILFPKGPAKRVARIAGLSKPEGCL